MISSNIEKIKQNIAAHAQKAAVTLIVVTKKVGPVRMENVVKAGATDIGENRIRDAEKKFMRLKKLEFTKHFIGHLQRNKVKKAVALFDVIHSVDSLALAHKIDEACKEQRKKLTVLLQVNVSGEKSKHGFRVSELAEAVKAVRALKHIKLVGLMTMAPFITPDYTRPYFRKLKTLARTYRLKELSMGMTNDYEIALEEGATMIRIGTAIFRK